MKKIFPLLAAVILIFSNLAANEKTNNLLAGKTDTLNYDQASSPVGAHDCLNDDKFIVRFTPPANGKILKMLIYCEYIQKGAVPSKLKFSVYKDNNGKPGEVLMTAAEVAFSQGSLSAGWNVFEFEPQWSFDISVHPSFHIGFEVNWGYDDDIFYLGVSKSGETNRSFWVQNNVLKYAKEIGPDYNNACWMMRAVVEEGDNCKEFVANTSFIENFDEFCDDNWRKSNGKWIDGNLATFTPDNVNIEKQGTESFLNLRIDNKQGTIFGSEISSVKKFLYGRFIARLKTLESPGVINAFFLYEDAKSNNPSTLEQEIDFEIFGKNDNGKYWVQLGFFNGYNQDGTRYQCLKPIELEFNPTTDYHLYEIRWEPGKISWFIDNKLIWEKTGIIPDRPMYIIANNWITKANWYPAILQNKCYSESIIESGKAAIADLPGDGSNFNTTRPMLIDMVEYIYHQSTSTTIGFEPNPDGFSIPNGEIDLFEPNKFLWPNSYCNSFNSSNQPAYFSDDFRNLLKDPSKIEPKNYCLFPDWELFADAFGSENVYENTTPPSSPEERIYRPSAVSFWEDRLDKWGGSCYGFAILSYLFYCHIKPLPQNISKTWDLIRTDEIRNLINKYFLYQYGNPAQSFIGQFWNYTPNETLLEIKKSFATNCEYNAITIYQVDKDLKRSRGHIVNPYKIEEYNEFFSGKKMAKIYVYDNCFPGNESINILINQTDNSWEYFQPGPINLPLLDRFASFTYSGTLGCIPSGNIFEIAKDKPRLSVIKEKNDMILDLSGNRKLNYNCLSQIYINDYKFSIRLDSLFSVTDISPILIFTGSLTKHLGVQFNNDKFIRAFLEIKPNINETSNISFNNIDKILNVTISNPDTNLKKRISFDLGKDSLKLYSPDKPSTISYNVISNDINSENFLKVKDISMKANDSITFVLRDSKSLEISNFCSDMKYGIYLRKMVKKIVQINFDSVFINKGHKHKIVIKDWNNLNKTKISIDIDTDYDGIADTNIILQNEVLDVAIENLILIDQISISPNPFDTKTNISFNLASSQGTKLSLFDVFGKNIRSLFSGYAEQGEHSLTWDGTDDAGNQLPNGVYFLQLKTGNSIITEKVILAR